MKITTYILISSLIILNFGCGEHQKTISNTSQEYLEVPLRKWVNGYYVESQEPNHTDNLIYNECLEVLYEYHYQKNGELKYFKQDVIMEDWEFIKSEDLNNGIGVKHIKLTASNPNLDYDNSPQSAVRYELLNSDNVSIGVETTGVIENYWNIALHNTRSGFFQSLFSFPWPTIKFPIKDNKSWKWNFSYNSDLYGDSRIFKLLSLIHI